ncbi:hypothetical protein [Pseudolabrys sp. FHR47]|uniref:hypothetical protein n=1 Tax=Pseudolabrys sp. FHR47 TaxID=2562284 RepID=UPI0010BE80F0|nr:hypothetical protein [Pseudolabrys sp. FHR47]
MTPASSFLDTLKDFAENAGAAEEALRREFAERTKRFADERAFAYRRYNLMRSVAEAVATAESEEIAVAAGNGILRTKLGWDSDSEARTETLSRFSAVSKEMFAALAPPDDEAPPPDVLAVLRAFEDWYAETHPQSFWVLFEHYMPETPLVDF